MFRYLAFLLLACTLHAGGNVSGKVTDAANGNPISGATIVLIKGGTFIFATTTTAADGVYSFANIPSDTYTIRATSSGFQTASVGASIKNNKTTNVDFPLQHNPGSIVGKVRDTFDLTAIPGAIVQALKGEIIVASATTNDTGYFAINNLAAGNYLVRAIAEDHQTFFLGSTVLANQSVTVNFFLQPYPGTISGRAVSASTSTPLSGAIVDVLQELMVIASATTDGSGNYTISGLSPGNYIVRASVSNYQIESIGSNVNPRGKATVNFSLMPNPGSIAGQITNSATSYPVAGANVTVFRDTLNLATVLTDPQGNYVINDLAPGNYTVRMNAETYQTADVGASVSSDTTTPVSLALKSQPGNFTGEILDHTTWLPLSGALVRVFKDNDLIGSAITDENGNYSINGLAPDNYTLIAQLSNYQTIAVGGEIAADRAKAVNLELNPAPRKIAGFVTLNAHPETPIPEAIVTIFQGSTFFAIRVSDARGFYSIDTLPPNLYFVRVSANNYQTETFNADLLSNLSQTVSFSLTPHPGAIRGRITDINNLPIIGASVVVLDETASITSILSDDHGYYSLSGLAPGTYTIRASADTFQTNAHKITIQSNQTTTADFSLEGESTFLSGQVVDQISEVPIPGAAVYVFQEDELIQSVLTDSNGNYSTDRLAPGFYTVEVSANNHETASQHFLIAANTTNTWNFTLIPIPSPPNSITGNTLINRFFTQSDRIHRLHWQKSLSHNVNSYHIYRDGTLIANIPATHPLHYQDHRRIESLFHKYEVRAVDQDDKESHSVTVTLQ